MTTEQLKMDQIPRPRLYRTDPARGCGWQRRALPRGVSQSLTKALPTLPSVAPHAPATALYARLLPAGEKANRRQRPKQMPCGPVLRANRADIAVRQSLVLIRARPLCPGERPRRRIEYAINLKLIYKKE